MWNAVKHCNRVKAFPWQDEYAQACDMRRCISKKGIIKRTGAYCKKMRKIIMFIKIQLSKYLVKSLFWWLSFAIFFHIVGLISILTFLSVIPISASLSSSF